MRLPTDAAVSLSVPVMVAMMFVADVTSTVAVPSIAGHQRFIRLREIVGLIHAAAEAGNRKRREQRK